MKKLALTKREWCVVGPAVIVFIVLMSMILFRQDWVDSVIFGEDFERYPVEWNKEDYERAFTLSPEFKEIEGDSFEIDILTHFENSEAMLIDTLLSFSGDTAEYNSFSQGNIEGCEVEETYGTELEREGDLLLMCLISPTGDPYSGNEVFATLNFDVVGEGTFGIEFLDMNTDGDFLESGKGEEYVLQN